MKITFFDSPAAFRRWLTTNHQTTSELLVGFHKKHTGETSLTYAEALDEALCFGWIDGVLKRIDDRSYTIRFTPRKTRSYWSVVNTKRVGQLTKLGRMHTSGLKTFLERDQQAPKKYAYENAARELSQACENKIKANQRAWEFYQAQAPWYRRTVQWWIMSPKQETTRERRLALLISDSEKGLRLARFTSSKQLTSPKTLRKA